MKFTFLILAMTFSVSAASAKAGLVCKQKEDRDTCVVVAFKDNIEIYREELEFRVLSESSQKCDYGADQFFYKEYPLTGTDLKAAIYAGWEKYRLAVYPIDDIKSTNRIVQAWFNRSPVLEQSSAIDGTIDNTRYFISCETAEHIR